VAIRDAAQTKAVAADATKASFFNVPSNVGSHVRTVVQFCGFRPRAKGYHR
jgi:hypothetical protein